MDKTSTFILCDSALSRSLFRAASIELVAGEGVILLLINAPVAAGVEDTVPVPALDNVDWGLLGWHFCAREVTLTIWMSFSSLPPSCCCSGLLLPLISPETDGFALLSEFVEVCLAKFTAAVKPPWWDASRRRFWR